MAKKAPKVVDNTAVQHVCVHCDHFHAERMGECCFCKKVNVADFTPVKSREEHLADIGEDEIEI